MDPYTFFPNLDDLITDVPDKSILSQRVYDSDQAQMVVFSFAAGEELSEHTSTHAALLHIVSGEATLTLGGDTMQAQAGSWAWMQPNLPHSVVARTPVVMVLVMIKPPR